MSWERKEVASVQLKIMVDEVVGKQRPAFNLHQRHAYTPPKTRKAEKRIRDAWISKFGDKFADFNGEVHLTVVSCRELAKSNPKKRAGSADVQKPDADNIGKLVLDALNHLAFADDSQITEMHLFKLPRIPFSKGSYVRIHINYYEEKYVRS